MTFQDFPPTPHSYVALLKKHSCDNLEFYIIFLSPLFLPLARKSLKKPFNLIPGCGQKAFCMYCIPNLQLNHWGPTVAL